MTEHEDMMRQAKEAIDATKKLVAAHKAPTIGKNQCEHGQLARVCERCADAKTIADLEAKLRLAIETLTDISLNGEENESRDAAAALNKIGRMP